MNDIFEYLYTFVTEIIIYRNFFLRFKISYKFLNLYY